MNIQEYIATGILEAFVLDQLSEPERDEVLKMAQAYPEVRAEIDRIEEGQLRLAERMAVVPPARLKTAILDDIVPESTSNLRVDPVMPGIKPFPHRYFSISSGVAAAIAILFSIYFYVQWHRAEAQYRDLLAQNMHMAEQIELTREQLQTSGKQLKFLSQPGVETIEMKGLDISPQSVAHVYWNRKTHQVRLKSGNLPEPTAGKQYQLWAIVEGQPVDAGVIDGAESLNTYQSMKNIEGATAFAVTLEPLGGSKTPTLNQMYVMGKTAPEI
ncbi:anti-sigma factor domain-containing protein [Saccharicrinis sp. FJH54]|uniref:anti-sigma factor n=1 Tax=Saccharicrinis sp. FJH54 TaxID=3344665 RepID=UPI0035D4A70A